MLTVSEKRKRLDFETHVHEQYTVILPRATVQNAIPSTSGQLFDCSKITYEITALLPDQLKKKGRNQLFLLVNN